MTAYTEEQLAPYGIEFKGSQPDTFGSAIVIRRWLLTAEVPDEVHDAILEAIQFVEDRA